MKNYICVVGVQSSIAIQPPNQRRVFRRRRGQLVRKQRMAGYNQSRACGTPIRQQFCGGRVALASAASAFDPVTRATWFVDFRMQRLFAPKTSAACRSWHHVPHGFPLVKQLGFFGKHTGGHRPRMQFAAPPSPPTRYFLAVGRGTVCQQEHHKGLTHNAQKKTQSKCGRFCVWGVLFHHALRNPVTARGATDTAPVLGTALLYGACRYDCTPCWPLASTRDTTAWACPTDLVRDA